MVRACLKSLPRRSAGPFASAKWSRGFVGCRFQNQAFENLPLIDGQKVAKSVSRIDGQTHRFLGKDSNLKFGHGKSISKVDSWTMAKPQYSLEKTQISYPLTKIYLSSRKFIRKHGRARSRSGSGNKIREKCRDGIRKFVNLIIRRFADAGTCHGLYTDLCIRPHDLSATLPPP